MGRLLSATSGSVALVMVLLVGLPASGQEPPSITRLDGLNRVETAISISADDWEDAGAGAVVLAREDVFADAIAGGPLAAATGGPLLLTPRGSLAPIVEAELQRILPTGRTVYLLGGLEALEGPVEDRLSALGYVPVRLAGDTRYETALAIAGEAAPDPAFLAIADGNEFPDALIAGSLASRFLDGVLVLTDGPALPPEVEAYLAEHPESTEVIHTTIGPDGDEAAPGRFNVGGATPADRSVAAAAAFYARDGVTPGGVALASSEEFPDALAGAPHAFRNGALPLLLTPGDALPGSVIDYVTGLDGSGPSYVYGGNLAISESAVDQLQAALEG